MKDLQRALLDAVGNRISASGFDSKPVGQSFLKKFDGGRSSFHLAFVTHPSDVDVVADVAVRLDALEDLVNASNLLLSKKEKAQTYSLGAELGALAGEGQQRWTLADPSDIPAVADRLIECFLKIGLPYLERASSPPAAYQLLTAPGRQAWLHSPIHASRAKRVVGLAQLMGRAEEARTQAAEQAAALREMKDPGLNDFLRFVASLGLKA